MSGFEIYKGLELSGHDGEDTICRVRQCYNGNVNNTTLIQDGENWFCPDHYTQANGVPATPTPEPTVTLNAPNRASTLPEDPTQRKTFPVASGVLDYFPDAIAAIANVSWKGNEQHNPGTPLHWDRAKSTDEADTLLRHFLQRGTLDKDGLRHTAKMAWRALALLQKEIEAEGQ